MEKNNYGIKTIAPKSELDIFEKTIELSNTICSLKNKMEAIYGFCEEYTGPKIVVYAGTQNRYQQMERSAKMLLSNSDVDKIYFFIEHETFPEKLPSIIETICAKDQNYFPNYCANFNSPWTYMALIRLALHNIFPQYDRVLWLDTDTLILDDISGIFNAPLGNHYYFGAVEENRHYIEYLSIRKLEDSALSSYQAYPQIAHQEYYNSGVLLENLKLLREDGMGNKLISKVNNFRTNFPDQNVINQMCRNRILGLSHEYNWSYFTGDSENPRIVHTSTGKLQNGMDDIAKHYDSLSFSEIMENKYKPKLVYEIHETSYAYYDDDEETEILEGSVMEETM